MKGCFIELQEALLEPRYKECPNFILFAENVNRVRCGCKDEWCLEKSPYYWALGKNRGNPKFIKIWMEQRTVDLFLSVKKIDV